VAAQANFEHKSAAREDIIDGNGRRIPSPFPSADGRKRQAPARRKPFFHAIIPLGLRRHYFFRREPSISKGPAI
jgi:hypothetical protein